MHVLHLEASMMNNKTIKEICSRCGSSDRIFDPETGEEICSSCGLVIRERILEQGQDRGIYSSENRQVEGMKQLSPEAKQKMRRLLRYDTRLKQETLVPQTMRHAMKELNRLIDKLHLTKSVKERASSIYTMAQGRNLIVRGTISGFVAASVYAACREMEIPRTLHEISIKSTEDIKDVSRMYRLLLVELNLQMPTDTPMKLVPRIAAEVGVRPETDLLAIEILMEAKNQKALMGKDPRALAAAALYIACKAKNEKCTQGEIAEVAGISEVSLRKRLRDLKAIDKRKDGL
jgi:transcription initiation factor TFIIB